MSEPIDITTDKGTVEEQIRAAFTDPAVDHIYANGFYCGRSNSDVFVALQLNGNINTVLNLSFTCAKSLQKALASLISDLEIKTDHSIMTMDEVIPETYNQ